MTRALAALLLVSAPGACDDSPTGPEPGAPVHLWPGAYSLTGVDGQALPTAVFEGRVEVGEEETAVLRVTALEGTLTLNVDGTYELRVRHAATFDGGAPFFSTWTDRGQYTVGAAGLAFTSTLYGHVSFGGTADGDGIITPQDLAGEGRVAGYRFGRN